MTDMRDRFRLFANAVEVIAPPEPLPHLPFADFAAMTETELLVIDEHTSLPAFQREVRWNAAYYRLARGI